MSNVVFPCDICEIREFSVFFVQFFLFTILFDFFICFFDAKRLGIMLKSEVWKNICPIPSLTWPFIIFRHFSRVVRSDFNWVFASWFGHGTACHHLGLLWKPFVHHWRAAGTCGRAALVSLLEARNASAKRSRGRCFLILSCRLFLSWRRRMDGH